MTDPKQITVHIKTLPESAHALLDGVLADVWDEAVRATLELAEVYDGHDLVTPDNPYRKRSDEKPEPTRDEVAQHLDLSHNWRSDRRASLKILINAHEQDHIQRHVRHEMDDLS